MLIIYSRPKAVLALDGAQLILSSFKDVLRSFSRLTFIVASKSVTSLVHPERIHLEPDVFDPA